MALQLTVKRDMYDDGVQFEIAGLGLVNNGETITLTEDQERSYAQFAKKTVLDGLANNTELKISGTPILTGDVTKVLGYDPNATSDAPPVTVVGADMSPATSVGETWESRKDEEVVVAPEPVVTAPATTTTTDVLADKPSTETT